MQLLKRFSKALGLRERRASLNILFIPSRLAVSLLFLPSLAISPAAGTAAAPGYIQTWHWVLFMSVDRLTFQSWQVGQMGQVRVVCRITCLPACGPGGRSGCTVRQPFCLLPSVELVKLPIFCLARSTCDPLFKTHSLAWHFRFRPSRLHSGLPHNSVEHVTFDALFQYLQQCYVFVWKFEIKFILDLHNFNFLTFKIWLHVANPPNTHVLAVFLCSLAIRFHFFQPGARISGAIATKEILQTEWKILKLAPFAFTDHWRHVKQLFGQLLLRINSIV